MKNLGRTKDGQCLFECSACKHLVIYKTERRCDCIVCGHIDLVHCVIRYDWRRRPVGYSRLFSAEQVKNVLVSLKRAELTGMQFIIKETFAGLRITVVSIPPPDPTQKSILE